MAKVRHVAMMVKDAAALRDFYQKGFGFEQCYGPSASGSIMVMDGLFNLALLQVRQGESEVVGTHRADGGEADQRLGINHFGFVVDDVDESVRRVGADLRHAENPQDGRPAEMRVVDPWGNNFDLSARGFFGRDEVRLPAIRKVVIQTDDPEQMADFYASKLDLQREGVQEGGEVDLCDGIIQIALVPKGPLAKKGIQYVGIQIDDWEAQARRFSAMGRTLPVPGDPDAEVTLPDPEGNLLVLSQRGWSA